MLKLLRHPVSFLVLTCLVTTWAIRAAVTPYPYEQIFNLLMFENTPEFEYLEGDQHRPIYELTRWCLGRDPVSPLDAGFSLNSDNLAIKTNEGLFVLYRYILDAVDNEDSIEGMVRMSGTTRFDEFGLLKSAITRQRTTVKIFPMHGWLPLTIDEVSQAYNSLHKPGTPPVVGGVQTRWTIKPLAAVHDLVYFAALLAWIYALLSIPRWKFWSRNKNPSCSSCSYDITGLTSQTCPECGKNLPPPLDSQAEG